MYLFILFSSTSHKQKTLPWLDSSMKMNEDGRIHIRMLWDV